MIEYFGAVRAKAPRLRLALSALGLMLLAACAVIPKGPVAPPPPPNEPDPALIEAMEKLLAEAKDGSLNGIAFSSFFADDTYTIDWYGRTETLRMLGGITVLVDQFCDAIREAEVS